MDRQHENDAFYHSPQWQRMRQRILRRDAYMCQQCKRYGKRIEAVEVHHIKHLEDFPEEALNPDNLISLCKRCHKKAHPETTKKSSKCRGFARY